MDRISCGFLREGSGGRMSSQKVQVQFDASLSQMSFECCASSLSFNPSPAPHTLPSFLSISLRYLPPPLSLPIPPTRDTHSLIHGRRHPAALARLVLLQRPAAFPSPQQPARLPALNIRTHRSHRHPHASLNQTRSLRLVFFILHDHPRGRWFDFGCGGGRGRNKGQTVDDGL